MALLPSLRNLFAVTISLGILTSGCVFTPAHGQTPYTTQLPSSSGNGFITSGNIAQPLPPKQWRGQSSSAQLKGRLEASGAYQWYQQSNINANLYTPKDWPTKQSISLAKRFKLDAAEQQLKKLLAKNPNNAGAHHGLALVNFYRTSSSDGTYRGQQDKLLSEAIQHAMSALRLQPGYADAHLNLSKLYAERLYRLPDAKEFAANAYHLAPNNSHILTQVGKLTLDDAQESDTINAVKLLKRATQLNSKNSSAYTQLARGLAMQGNHHEALTQLNTALWLQPNYPPAHHLRGTIYEYQHNEAAAVQSYQQALAQDPEYLPASMDLANLYQRRQNWPHAIETLQNSYHSLLHSNHPARHTMALTIARAALKNNQHSVAETYANQLLLDPATPADITQQANVVLTDSNTHTAKQELALASGYGGDLLTTAEAHTNLQAALQAQRGNTTAKLVATKLYGQARQTSQISPAEQTNILNNPPLTANDAIAQGEVFQARFDPMRANAAYQLAARSADNPEAAIQIGDMLLTLGQPEAAKLAFSRVLNNGFSTASPAALMAANSGLQTLASNQQAMALQWASLEELDTDDRRYEAGLQRLLQLDANHADAHWALARLYEDRQQWPQAIRHYHWLVTVAPTHQQAAKANKKLAKLTEKQLKSS